MMSKLNSPASPGKNQHRAESRGQKEQRYKAKEGMPGN